ISPSAGNINTVGTGSITIVGSGSTLTTELTGLTNHSVLVGAGTATITSLTVGTTGQVLIGASGANPAFGSSLGTNLQINYANIGGSAFFAVTNSHTTNSGSTARLSVS